MRILLILVALAAVITVLWSTWRLDRRLFAAALVLVLVASLLFGIGVWQSTEREWRELDTDGLSVDIGDARGMEAGIRLRGHIGNHTEHSLSRLQLEVRWLDCDDEGACELVGRERLELREHVAPGRSQPWSAMIRMPADLLEEGSDWEVELLGALGYAGREGERIN